MFRTSQSNKRPVESFLVSTGDAALANIAEAGNALTNSSTGAVRLANGQLGIINADSGSANFNTFTAATPTVANAARIKFVQGTEHSANPAAASATYPLWVRPFEASSVVEGANRVAVTAQAYQTPSHDTWVIGADSGTGVITAEDNTEYSIDISFWGRIIDEMYNPQGNAGFKPSFTTPDYTALSTAEPVDHLIQNLTWIINRNSSAIAASPRLSFAGNMPIVAFAIDTTGAAGSAIAGLSAGSTVAVVSTSTGTRSITLTQAMKDSLDAADTELGGSASILTISLADAGTVTGGVADAIVLMALDRELSYEDRIPQVKIRMNIGLQRGFEFNLVNHVRVAEAFEGQGTGRQMYWMYANTHGQRKYSLDHTLDPVINFPNPIDQSVNYKVYVVESVDVNQIDTSNLSESPKKTIICVPTADTTTIAGLEAALNSWLNSVNAPLITI